MALGRGAARAGGGYHSGGRRGLLIVGEAQFLEGEHLARPGKGGQHGGVGDVVGGGAEARIEAAEETEDELLVVDGFADVPEGSGLDLERLAVFVDRRVALL